MWRFINERRKLLNSVVARTLFVFTFCLVSGLFFWQSPPAGPTSVAHLDKVVHFGLFFVLAASMQYAFRMRYLWSLSWLLLYAVAIEWIQYYIPGRGADGWDVVADMAGALSFFIVFSWYKQKRRN
ncbi:hypothetical protein CWE14_12020 [Aliidiomarina soli]|uniref:VanZ-like domain-containing protein n=1 Tax=Aliidiomarina soli TaxID=1928574 RepID=A0A432WEA4_9GAMM|nr:hypothetical protein CWE14_12020 [Aliidiomarina soli]